MTHARRLQHLRLHFAWTVVYMATGAMHYEVQDVLLRQTSAKLSTEPTQLRLVMLCVRFAVAGVHHSYSSNSAAAARGGWELGCLPPGAYPPSQPLHMAQGQPGPCPPGKRCVGTSFIPASKYMRS